MSDRILSVSAQDMAEVLNRFLEGEMPEGWSEKNRRAYSNMVRIVGNPFGEIPWRIADDIMCAMGCPHLLINGRITVYEGEPVRQKRTPRDGYLPAGPFQVWLRTYKENYPTQTAMYNDLHIPYVAAKNYMKVGTQYIPAAIIKVALRRARVPMEQLYPEVRNGNGRH